MLQYNNNNFDEVFHNNERDNLDKMAREINNKKKYQNNMMKNVSKNISENEKTTIKGIEAFSNDTNFSFSPQTNFYDKNGNYKSDFMSGLPTPLDEQSNNNSDIFTLKSANNYSDKYNDSVENFDDISSEYSFLPKKKKKHLRLNNEHLKEYSENDDKLILNHIQNCKECKYHLLNILKNENHLLKNEKKIIDNKKEEKFFGLDYKELKDIIILIIIGIIIIFVLDIFLRH